MNPIVNQDYIDSSFESLNMDQMLRPIFFEMAREQLAPDASLEATLKLARYLETGNID